MPMACRKLMRGEETQILGAYWTACPANRKQRFACPVAIPKWVRVRAGQILGFSTQMTGEGFRPFRPYDFGAEFSIVARRIIRAPSRAAWIARGRVAVCCISFLAAQPSAWSDALAADGSGFLILLAA
jgi:hypothetical protein